MRRQSGLRGGRLNAAIWGLACASVMSFGYNQSVAGGVLETESFRKQFPQMFESARITETIVAVYTAAGFFGALICIFLGDILGRRNTIWLAAFTDSIGIILMGTSFQFAQLIVSRVVLGLGVGGIISTTSVWQAELSKPHSRGSHVSAFGIFGGVGLALATWISFGTHFVNSSFSWRFPFLIQLILPVIVMAFIHTLPESPRWLVKKNRISEAEEAFSAIYDVNIESDVVQRQVRDIQLSLELAPENSIKAMFAMGPQRTLHRTILACSAQMFLQMTGVNAIAYYSPTIFKQYLGFSTTIAGVLAGSSNLTLALGAVLCSQTVDRFGRRPLFMGSAAGMSACLAIVAGLVSSGHEAASKAAVFFIFLYYICYTLGWFGLPFLFASEMAPSHVRASICGLSTCVTWLFNFLVAQITPSSFESIGYQYFIVYAVINAAAIPVVYWLYPESNGLTLEQIDEIFVESKSIFDPVKVAKRLPKQSLSEFLVDKGKIDEEAVRIENINEVQDDNSMKEKAEK